MRCRSLSGTSRTGLTGLRVFTVWSAVVGLGRARQEKYNYSLIDIKYDGLSRVGRGPLRTGGRHC